MKTARKIEFGDFQTPLELAQRVCRLIRAQCGEFDSVLEPTCGRGAFLEAAGEIFASARLLGFELNPAHAHVAREAMAAAGTAGRSEIRAQDFFTVDWPAVVNTLPGRLLLLGNPPWVTNAQVAALGGANLPEKKNFQGLRGIAARTGKANFDISEWMLIRLIEAVRPRAAVLAMLCKTATARKVLRHAWRGDGRIAHAALYRIDADLHFDAAVEACLLLAELGRNGPSEADVFADLAGEHPVQRFGLVGRELVADLPAYRRWQHLEGVGPYQWRSGLKHDCASVMELRATEHGRYRNQLGEEVELEPEVVFPLLKCTQLAHGRVVPEKCVLVTQRRVGEPTAKLEAAAPKAWAYLQRHRDRFEARKSSIYHRGEPFALFGIGDYAFAPWKVAVSGLHRPPRFVVVPPHDGRPVMFDDTCYFIPFWSEAEATATAEVLNSEVSAQFLQALILPEAKRAITAELLHRLNLRAMAVESGLVAKWDEARRAIEVAPANDHQLEMVMEPPAR
jgi:hypothetical protein